MKSSETLEPTGWLFDAPGSIHVHVDGGASEDLRHLPEQQLEQQGYLHKYSDIVAAATGTQRNDKRQIYQLHTPGPASGESLEYFSTTLLHRSDHVFTPSARLQLIRAVRTLLSEIYFRNRTRALHAVVEVERVVGCLESEDPPAYSWPNLEPLGHLFEDDLFPFIPNSDARYEVHFGIDIPKATERVQPIKVEDLLQLYDTGSLSVGGWFLFDHPSKWAFRSNMFVDHVSKTQSEEWRTLLARQWRQYPRMRAIEAQFKVLVEESLGVWNTDTMEHRFGDTFVTVPELLAWENELVKRNAPRPAAFWVVTGNFLGDRYDAIIEAMQRNIQGGVKYLYALSSYSDVKRWRRFKEVLKQRLGDKLVNDETVKAYLIDMVPPLENAFVALYRGDQEPEGYRLDMIGCDVVGADAMPVEDTKKIVRVVSRLVDENEGSVRRLVQVYKAESFRAAVVYVTFGGWRHVAPPPTLQQMKAEANALDGLDTILASLASQHNGSVAFWGDSGILVVFRETAANSRGVVKNAYELALALLQLFDEENGQRGDENSEELGFRGFQRRARLIVDYGVVDVGFRSQSAYVFGDLLFNCRLALDRMSDGTQLITQTAVNELPQGDVLIKGDRVHIEDSSLRAYNLR
jgi:hypothetical protein